MKRGFTLVEILVAMSLVLGVLLPASFWLFKSRASRAAWEKFQAVQVLEMSMNRAFLLRQARDTQEEAPGTGGLRVDIRVIRDGAETRLQGSIRDRQGRSLARLESAFFGSAEP